MPADRQKRTRMEKFLTTASLTDMQNTLFSLVGRGRLELPTNGLKVPRRTSCGGAA